MIPRLAAAGASFKGAFLYYLHDKREDGEEERATDARVAWTYTLNLPTDDPVRAQRIMIDTARAAPLLKRAAGIKATGKKLAKPVMAMSLSWSPDEDPPAPHEMLEAAQEALAALGLEEHQAVVIAHQDAAHPHVHLVVNKVHPTAGVAWTGSASKKRLSVWAQAYEQRHGRVLCQARVANNLARQAGRVDRQPRVSRAEWAAAKRDPAEAARIRATLAAMFSDLRIIEGAGDRQRGDAVAALLARRKTARQALRQRYAAAVEAAADPATASRHAKLAADLIGRNMALSLADLTRDRSTFTHANLVRHVGRHTKTVDEFTAVLSRLNASPELVPLGFDTRGEQRFTTREFQDMERRMLDHALKIQARPRFRLAPARPESAVKLSGDQRAAQEHVLGAEGVSCIVGYAGTGKSTLLGAARRSWEAAGFHPIGMTISGVAADGLKAGSGIESKTIASRLLAWEAGRDLPTHRTVLVVDEAGMLGSRQMERVLHHAAKAGAKVVLVGDYEQLQAIDAGGAFRSLAGRFGTARLDTIRRQREAWQQQATAELATAKTGAALDRYAAAGREHAHETRDEARAAMAAQWREHRATAPAATRIMLAYNRDDVADLNARARAVLREAGQLGTDTRLTTASGRQVFAAGDRIYFTKNDAGLGVRNGTLATVERIKGQTVVARLDGDDGRRVTFGLAAYNHIDHGYAATVHKSQGITVDRAFVLAGKMMNRHAAYVAMSRHRDRVDLHWDGDTFRDRARMVRALSRESVKDTSLDYDDAAPRKRGRPSKAQRAAPTAPDSAAPAESAPRRAAPAFEAAGAADQPPAPAPLAIEGPRPEDQPMPLYPAELAAFDRETLLLTQALAEHQDAQRAEESRDRQDVTREAARQWGAALMRQPAPAPAVPRPQRPRGLTFDL